MQLVTVFFFFLINILNRLTSLPTCRPRLAMGHQEFIRPAATPTRRRKRKKTSTIMTMSLYQMVRTPVRRGKHKGTTQKPDPQDLWDFIDYISYVVTPTVDQSLFTPLFCFFLFNTEVSFYVQTLFSHPSQFFMPVFHVADVLTASTASYGLEGKCTALTLCTSVYIYFCFAVVACGL